MKKDMWSIPVNTVRDTSETSITGASSQSSGGGVAFPKRFSLVSLWIMIVQ